MTTAYEYAEKNATNFREQLKEWLRIPSISTDSAYQKDVQRAADWLANDMNRIGLNNVQVFPTNRHPVVYGEWLEAGDDAPTILVYGHYDVQPAQKSDGWENEPFDPIEKDGKIFARGATDDKGQTLVQLKAAESLLASNCPVNIKYLIEGEEEIGSPNLADFVREHTDLLQANVCLISDTGVKSPTQPSLVYGLRGMVAFEAIFTGPRRDLHSGMAGGMVHNPSQVVAEIAAQLHDETGRITVPDFYADVATVPDDERALLNKGDYSDDDWERLIGAPKDWGEREFTRVERTGIRPTLEINGIWGGYTGEGFKTVIGAQAGLKISCRLVPNQDPHKIGELVKDYIRELTPETVTVEFKQHGTGDPALTDPKHPAIQAAVKAYGYHWDNDPIMVRNGGSLPIVADFQRILDIPVVLLGFGLPDSGIHGPNENFDTNMFHKGIDTVITYMQEIANAEL